MSAVPAARLTRKAAAQVSKPRLTVVAAPRRRYGAIIYISICAVALLGGSGALLWLNTALAAGSFEILELEGQLAEYKTLEEVHLEQLTALSEPDALSKAARDLGMVETHAVGYLSLAEKSVIGPGAAVASGPAGADGSDAGEADAANQTAAAGAGADHGSAHGADGATAGLLDGEAVGGGQ